MFQEVSEGIDVRDDGGLEFEGSDDKRCLVENW